MWGGSEQSQVVCKASWSDIYQHSMQLWLSPYLWPFWLSQVNDYDASGSTTSQLTRRISIGRKQNGWTAFALSIPWANPFLKLLTRKTWKEAGRWIMVRQLPPSGGWQYVSDAGQQVAGDQVCRSLSWLGHKDAKICGTGGKNWLNPRFDTVPLSDLFPFGRPNTWRRGNTHLSRLENTWFCIELRIWRTTESNHDICSGRKFILDLLAEFPANSTP